MGDYADMHDVDRAMRCEAGQKKLKEIQASLIGKTVAAVDFSNDVDAVLVTITFTTNESVEVFLPELMLDALRETFQADIREEYYQDYPERRPKQKEGDKNDGEQEES